MKATLKNWMGNDLTVVNAARVSFNKESDFDEYGELKTSDEKLIRYLAQHKHFSPFGHCFASFHVKAPIFVRSQLVKHEYLRINEVSRRYVDETPTFWMPEKYRNKSKDKKQGSEGVHPNSELWKGLVEIEQRRALKLYEEMIADKVAPEMARSILPQSMYTEWIWSGSLDAFSNMYNLRTGPGAQEEAKDIALQIGEAMEPLYPISWPALTQVEW